MKTLKKIKWNKNTAFIGIVLFVCVFVLAAKTPSSHMEFTVQYAENVGADILYVNEGCEKWFIRPNNDVSTVSTFQMDNYKMNFESMLISFEGEAPTITDLYILSRKHVVRHIGPKQAADMYRINGQAIEFNESFLEIFNKTSKTDWLMKAQIIGGLFIFLFVMELVIFIVRHDLSAKIGRKLFLYAQKYWIVLAAIVVCLLSSYYFYENGVDKTVEQDLEMIIPADEADVEITNVESAYQEFVSKKEIVGLKIKFGTFQKKLKGDYLLKVYDTETDKVVEKLEVAGRTIKDNNYISFNFENALKANTKYKVSIAAKGTLPEDEKLIIWTSVSDVYQMGDSYYEGEKLAGDWCFSILEKQYNSRNVAIPYVVLFVIIIALVLSKNEDERKNTVKMVALYGLLIGMFILQMVYHRDTHSNLYRYDENAQISYGAYIAKNHEIVPDFKNVTLLIPYGMEEKEAPFAINNTNREGKSYLKFTDTINYLGHPPLYYWILTATGSFQFEGDAVIVNMSRLRTFNMILTLISIGLFLYIGASRIDKKRLELHLLYGASVVFMPLLAYEGVTVNNDNLNLLAVGLFMLGALRFVEEKQNFGTYALICIGICIAMFTKTTAGLMLLVGAAIFLIWSSIKAGNLKTILNKEFAFTLPLYIVVFVYFVAVYLQCKTFQPTIEKLSPEQFLTYPAIRKPVSEWQLRSIIGYFEHFLSEFFNQWGGATGGTISKLFFKLMWLWPVVLWLKVKEWNKKKIFALSMSFAIYFTVLAQMIRGLRSYFYSLGRVGRQSRYYGCMVAIFTMVFIMLLKEFDLNRALFTVTIKDKKYIINGIVILKACIIVLSVFVMWGAFLNKLTIS